MGGEKKKDGYFPIAIYSELITTSLEGTNLKRQSKLNDDDFFFNFRHSKENDTVTHDSELVVIFQPQVQSLELVMKKFN